MHKQVLLQCLFTLFSYISNSVINSSLRPAGRKIELSKGRTNEFPSLYTNLPINQKSDVLCLRRNYFTITLNYVK